MKKRNEIAQVNNFRDYHQMKLALEEQNADEVAVLFDQLDAMTRTAYRQAKGEIDAVLAARFGIAVSDLRPWHYEDPFFQEAPDIYPFNVDSLYEKADIVDITKRFYASIGLPIDAMVANSNLFPADGKNPHAFCTAIDNCGTCWCAQRM